MDKEDVTKAVERLDNLYPGGWRSGDPACDTMTVILAHGLRLMTEMMLNGRK